MRFWANVYNPQGGKLGTVNTLLSASATKALDAAGKISLSFAAADQNAFNLLNLENRVEVWISESEQPRLLGKGIIRNRDISDTSSAARFTVSGPDTMDGLTRKNVLLGRSYNNQPISAIAASLVGLVSGWSIDVSAPGNQNARFDGISVLKALIRVAEEKGIHLREGLNPLSLEMGAFGEDNGVTALKPGTITHDISSRNDVLLIDKIVQKNTSRDVVNWIIPIGAGEGAAALTLKNSSHNVPSIIGPDGSTLYYLINQESIDQFGQIEKLVTFKEIAPIANTDIAKELAADALYDAATSWLDKYSQPLETYAITAKKSRTAIRPGDKMQVKYKGLIETESGSYTYIDLNTALWIMEATESVSDSGVTLSLKVSTVDREFKDGKTALGRALEAIEVQNVALKTFPVVFRDTSKDFCQADGSGPGGVNFKAAEFKFEVDEQVTDVVDVTIRFKSEPLFTPATVTTSATWTPSLSAVILKSPNYPSEVRLLINGEDVTEEYGGPWGNGTAAIDVELNITEKIINATGGMYRDHSIVFHTSVRNGSINYPGYAAGASGTLASNGVIQCCVKAICICQGNMPTS